MYLKKIISGIVLSLFLGNFALAASSTSYTIDVDELNTGGNLASSNSYKTNDTFIGFVDGNFGYSANYTMGSGLVYLEQLCGNGILEFGEKCDDGNTVSGDGCSATCQIEVVFPVCGNGTLEFGEQCDDGNTVSGDGCSASCTIEIPTPGGGYVLPVCGNGIRQGSEQCDDGNMVSGDGCSSICRIEEIPPEEIPPVIPEVVTRTITIKAWPEKRVNAPNNQSVQANMAFHNKDLRKTVLLTAYINDTGWGQISTDRLPDGIYDISLKGISHLTKVMRDVTINSEAHMLDFTFGETFYLIAGDVHTSKDDFINGLDISAAVHSLYGKSVHADLNRDGLVNGLDISIVVKNIYRYGERL